MVYLLVDDVRKWNDLVLHEMEQGVGIGSPFDGNSKRPGEVQYIGEDNFDAHVKVFVVLVGPYQHVEEDKEAAGHGVVLVKADAGALIGPSVQQAIGDESFEVAAAQTRGEEPHERQPHGIENVDEQLFDKDA